MGAGRQRITLGALVATVVVTALSSTPATGLVDCPAKTLCVFEDDSYGGKAVLIKGRRLTNKIAEKLNNRVSSALNERGGRAILFSGKNGKGERFCLAPHSSQPSMAFFTDRASSSKNTSNDDGCPP